MLVSLDVYRPAAQEQLKILADNNDILSLPIVQNQQPSEIASRAMNIANLNGEIGVYGSIASDKEGYRVIECFSNFKKINFRIAYKLRVYFYIKP